MNVSMAHARARRSDRPLPHMGRSRSRWRRIAVLRSAALPSWPARRPRRAWWRWGALAVGACVALALAIAVLSYRRQIFSYLTHWKGGPDQTWPYSPHGEPPPVHLAVVGDTGDSGTNIEATADTIEQIGATEPFDALLLLGDMIYPDGDPALLDVRVFEPFDGVIAEGADLLAVLGNHDVSLEKGDEIMQRLGMPGRWWQRVIGDVTIIGLDTTQIDNADQLAFLERSLEAADTTWTVVAMHHPP
ncbi:MAG: metallophosphoesterase family protein, partial [Ilumatobacteraceae bacterium]